jgi:hypothetical protein
MNRVTSSLNFLVRLFPWALCAALLVVIAQQKVPPPAERLKPAAPPATSVRDVVRKRPNKNHVLFTPEQWNEARDLLAKECRHRIAHINAMTAEGKKEGNVRAQKAFIVSTARDVTALNEELPALYPTRLREVQLEDEIYEVCLDYKRKGKQVLRDHLKPSMVELVRVGLQVRKGRISLVESAVAEQKKLLDADEQNLDKVVDRRLEETIAKAFPAKPKGLPTTGSTSDE